ncbi:MAG: rhodanese-like domain-containing protein [Ilumatobacter sp.]|jgi:rhodanese-related sulfurtransferase|uniref:rhodanese-like domain-containing protein n=1 Tax=Ilumatobacter sp. TaxID=1967498 RepID=UPI00391DC34F
MAIKSVQDMVAAAKEKLDNISPAEAKRRVDEEGALLVDIRDVRELQRTGVPAGAHHAPRGMLEFWVAPDSPYHQAIFAEDREFIFSCASGWRSALTAKTLKDMGLERVSHIETGFTGWNVDGMPIQPYDEWNTARKSADA